MIIKSFSVEDYCSISKAKNLPISNLSILIGSNNEGKSNILRALVLTLNYILYSEYSEERKYLPYSQRRRWKW